MTVIVRDVQAEDAEGFARVRRAALPYMLATAEQLVFDWAHAHPDSHYRPLVAVTEAGEIIGTAQVGIAHDAAEPGIGYANVYVDPAHLGRGAGTLLLRAAEEHLAERGARTLYSWVLDAPENLAWAQRRGTPPAVPPTSSGSTSPPPSCRRCRRRRPVSNCSRPRTSRPTPGRCSSWTR